MQDPIKILESVNTFYSQSFSQLITITVAVLAFAGIILPVVISILQKRFFKLEHQAIESSVHKKLKIEYDLSIKAMHNEYKKKEMEFDIKILKMKEEINKELAKAEGGIFHVQGNNELKSGYRTNAFLSFVDSAIKYMEAEDNKNLRVVLNICSGECLLKFTKITFQKDEILEKSFNELLEKLTKYNEKDNFTDMIINLKEDLLEAKAIK